MSKILKKTGDIFSSHPFFATVTVALIISAIFSFKGALQDVHWDAPLYLFRARYLTQLLNTYSVNAEQITALAGTAESQYWAFTRLGTPVLLGLISFLFGPTLLSIKIMSWTYTFMLACGVIFSVILSKKIIELFEKNLSTNSILLGGLISGGLYLSSDMFRYLSGNLISEVPAIFLASACILSLINAHIKQKISYAILSGFLAFLLYFVKMDAIWIYVSFVLIFCLFLIIQKSKEKIRWQIFIVSALSAATCFISYASYYHPLANPLNIIKFAESLNDSNINMDGYPAFPQLFVAMGLLFIGGAISTFFNINKNLYWLTFIWFILVLLPYISTIINDQRLQVRMLALIMLPLMITSTYGWATLLNPIKITRSKKQFILYPLVFIVISSLAISHAEPYKILRNLPGGWRLQYARQFLSTPNFQRKYFPLEELNEISQLLYLENDKKLVLWDKEEKPEYDEYIAILRYLAPEKMQINNFFQDFAPNEGSCELNKKYSGVEPVIFCTEVLHGEKHDYLANKAEMWVMNPTPCKTSSALFQSKNISLCSWP